MALRRNWKMITLFYICTFMAGVIAEMHPRIERGSILYEHGEQDLNWLDMDQCTEPNPVGGTRIELDFNITYFGQRFDHIYVSNAGYFYFEPYRLVIAPYFALVDINPNDDRQMVYYRTMKRDYTVDEPNVVIDQDEKEIIRRDNKIMEDMERCVQRTPMVGSDNFFAKHAVIVTWRNLTYAGAKRPPHGRDNENPKNTFQAVIVTHDDETYVIFNYDVIQWSQSQKLDGEDQWHAKMGFGTGLYNLKGLERFSGLPSGVNISNNTNSDIWGRYIFRIDDTLKYGDCKNESSGKLQVFGSLRGGEQFNINGPCFVKSDDIRCRFNLSPMASIAHGEYVALQKARCVFPFHTSPPGNITLSVSINDAPFDLWKTTLEIEDVPTSSSPPWFSTSRPVVSTPWPRFSTSASDAITSNPTPKPADCALANNAKYVSAIIRAILLMTKLSDPGALHSIVTENVSQLLNAINSATHLFQLIHTDDTSKKQKFDGQNLLFEAMDKLQKLDSSHTQQLLGDADQDLKALLQNLGPASLKQDTIDILNTALKKCLYIVKNSCN